MSRQCERSGRARVRLDWVGSLHVDEQGPQRAAGTVRWATAKQPQQHMDSGGEVLVCTLTHTSELSSGAAPCGRAVGPSGHMGGRIRVKWLCSAAGKGEGGEREGEGEREGGWGRGPKFRLHAPSFAHETSP